MEEVNNQPGFVPPTGGPGKVNPMSPNFMENSGAAPAPQVPDNPPAGGTLGSVPPPPPTPSSSMFPPSAAPAPASPVSPPPPKQVDIRTMASDQSSLKASGGLGVTPQSVRPVGKAPRKVDSAGRPVGGDKKKALLMGLGVLVFLGAAGAVANYFILPMFLSDTSLTEPPVITDGPAADLPVTPTIPALIHTSYFAEPVDVDTEVNVNTLSLVDLTVALAQTAASKADGETGTITEFEVTQGLSGVPVTANMLLEVLLPDVEFVVPLEEDFTGFMYDTGSEVRAGYIFALDAEAGDLEAAKDIFEDTFESSNQLSNLFLTSPGIPSAAGFKDGTAPVGGVATRWLGYSNEGTSIDYGWKGPFAVISTSFDGFKQVIGKVRSALPASQVSPVEGPAEEPPAIET